MPFSSTQRLPAAQSCAPDGPSGTIISVLDRFPLLSGAHTMTGKVADVVLGIRRDVLADGISEERRAELLAMCTGLAVACEGHEKLEPSAALAPYAYVAQELRDYTSILFSGWGEHRLAAHTGPQARHERAAQLIDELVELFEVSESDTVKGLVVDEVTFLAAVALGDQRELAGTDHAIAADTAEQVLATAARLLERARAHPTPEPSPSPEPRGEQAAPAPIEPDVTEPAPTSPRARPSQPVRVQRGLLARLSDWIDAPNDDGPQ